MFALKTVDNKPLIFFSNMQLSYSTNVVLGATSGGSGEISLMPLAVVMCQKPESPFLPRRSLNLDTSVATPIYVAGHRRLPGLLPCSY